MGLNQESVTRIGIAGGGRIVREVHSLILRRMPGVRVVAVADPDPVALAWCAAAFAPDPFQGCSSVEELLELDLDGVIVASPTGEHGRHARQVLSAGKALYLEKPIAATMEEAETVAAMDHGRAAMGFNYRCHPMHQQARQKIAAGDWGRIHTARSHFSFAPRELPPWKRLRSSGGGVLLDLGSHHLDLLMYLLGRNPVRVRAWIQSVQSEQDTARLELEFPEGIRADCFYSFCSQERDIIELTGDGAGARPRILNRYAPLRSPLLPLSRWFAFQRERLQSPWKEVSFRVSLAAWIDAVRGQAPYLTTLADGLCSMRIIAAAERSARTGEVILV